MQFFSLNLLYTISILLGPIKYFLKTYEFQMLPIAALLKNIPGCFRVESKKTLRMIYILLITDCNEDVLKIVEFVHS